MSRGAVGSKRSCRLSWVKGKKRAWFWQWSRCFSMQGRLTTTDAHWVPAALVRACAEYVVWIISLNFIMILDVDDIVDNCLSRQGQWDTEHYRKVIFVGPRLKFRQSSSRSFVEHLLGIECLGIVWSACKLSRPRSVKWEGLGIMKWRKCLADLEVEKTSTTTTLY